MKSVIGVDPGSEKSAYIWWNGKEILDKGISPNEELLELLDNICLGEVTYPFLAIESMMYIYIPKNGKLKGGGKDICDTLRWEGQFYRAWPGNREFVPVHVVKQAMGAQNDPGIKAALTLRFGAELTSGLKGKGYHLWRAAAVAVVHYDHLAFQAREMK